MAFPIDRVSYRNLSTAWSGQVVVADIDRTYLATHFSSLRGIARIPFERPGQKIDIAGMARLLRELRRGPGPESRETPLYFISASPKQLRPIIERKMALDGIVFDGTTFKDWGGVLWGRRLKRLREQVGFKLTALLASRAHLPVGAQEILIGDDLETDALTYALYADALSGRIPSDALLDILCRNGVLREDAEAITRSAREVPLGRGVLRAFIRLERHAETDDFLEYGPGCLGCIGAFQMAVGMWKLGALSFNAIRRVAAALVERKVEPRSIRTRLRDLVRRAVITAEEGERLSQALVQWGVSLPLGEPPDPDPRWLEVWRRPAGRLWTPTRFIDAG